MNINFIVIKIFYKKYTNMAEQAQGSISFIYQLDGFAEILNKIHHICEYI